MPIPAYPTPIPSVYPITLPNPSVSVVTPGERRLLSDLSGGPQQVRGIERDYKAVQDLEWGALDATQAAALNTWWTDTLTQGGAWFASTWPAPQGWVSVTRRFQGALQWAYIPGGFWRVSAKCLVRGVGLIPTVPGCIPWVQAQACPPVGAPVVFASGICMTSDPVTGYIWTGWRAGGTPVGGAGPYSGAYVLVYDPISMTLVDAIGLVGTGVIDSIEYHSGFVYAVSAGLGTARAAGSLPLVTKINASTRIIFSVGNSDYSGAVSILGLISQDSNGIYLSITGGSGTATRSVGADAPFPLGAQSIGSDQPNNVLFNPFSGARVYAAFGPLIDMRGSTNSTVDTTPYLSGGISLQQTRMAYKVCSSDIYLCGLGIPGVLVVNTATGVVRKFAPAFLVSVIYYSPESDTVYVEGHPTTSTPVTVRAYQGTSFALLAEYSTYNTGMDLRGNAIYLGCESFVVSNQPTGQIWRVGFPR